MPGLVAYSVAGLGFVLLAATELIPFPSFQLPPPPFPSPLHLRFHVAAVLAVLSLLSSIVSFSYISLPTLSVSLLFLLYSLSGLLSLSSSLPFAFPPHLLDLLATFCFFAELLLFTLRRSAADEAAGGGGIEHRYFDLLLAPILLCVAASAFSISRPRAAAPRLARAAGLALQGTWLVQMGFSFFTSAVAHGCQLHSRSRADYTIRCRTHDEFHRARAIATLQFNCHLALMVVAGTAAYAAAVAAQRRSQPSGYRPLTKELQMEGLPPSSRFTLDSDEEREEEQEIVAAEANRREANGVQEAK